ncbi:hypothetical protein [Streptomyces chartreusis]|uniref:hypothetical protein n=1 Tax=Streptomyces chartreusis TaxID=1969 RepID=UPI0013312B95|nr:hypothetical protein [Streptomyces chartreusis]
MSVTLPMLDECHHAPLESAARAWSVIRAVRRVQKSALVQAAAGNQVRRRVSHRDAPAHGQRTPGRYPFR